MRTSLSRYYKFVAPALLALLATLITAVQQGTFDGPAFEVGFAGLTAATLAFLVTNTAVGVSRYLKALVPTLTTAVALGIHYLVASEFNAVDARIALAGGLAALVTLLVPNTPAVGDAPVRR